MADETTPEEGAQTSTPEEQQESTDTSADADKWKALSRKHENDLEKERKEREKLEKALKERQDADKTDQEKAIEQAREEARNEARSEADKERRGDRLESAVTRLAAKGITVGEGDEKKTVRFADPEDAVLLIQRGDIDALFDDEGKVKTDALTDELGDLLRRKPHLAENGKTPPGDPDSRKGDPAKNDLESMTPADHDKAKYGSTK